MFRIVKPTTPTVIMEPHVLDQIMRSVGARTPETGGILLGPVDETLINDFYFDSTGGCTQLTYSPDTETLCKKMQEDWLPSGSDMHGFVHSHPGSLDEPSSGDLVYIERLLACNPEMQQFVCPIVIPDEFRIAVYIVRRDQPRMAVPAQLDLQKATLPPGLFSHRP